MRRITNQTEEVARAVNVYVFTHFRTMTPTIVLVHDDRSAWASDDEPCHQKISLDMWTFMRAQGSAQDADAQHVYVQCLQQPEMGLVELITPEVSKAFQTYGCIRMCPQNTSRVDPILRQHMVTFYVL